MAESPLLHNRYRILRRLGSGAFATVYLAEDTRMERLVAVKVVQEATDSDDRALREAKAAAKLNHPHIVHAYEVVQEQGRTLLFNEYIEGDTLRNLYAARRLSDRDIVTMGIQVCQALEHGHKRGVIHRDIKPENLMILDSDDIDVRVMDFGVARLEDHVDITREGDVVGTLAYMAPEQLAGEPVDAKADVYALGMTLYEGLTGRNPLRGKGLKDLVNTPTLAQLPPLRELRGDLPTELDEALHLALASDPEDRLSAAGMRKKLEKGLQRLPEDSPGPGLVERTASAVSLGPDVGRLTFVGTHLLAAGLAAVATVYLLGRSSLLPDEWEFPIAVGLSFAALLSPVLGAAVVVALYSVAALAYGIGWGVVCLALALPLLALLRWRRRGWGALLPLATPWLAGVGLGLAAPPLAGFLLRRWGAFVGFLSGTALAIAAGLTGWSDVPHLYTVDVSPLLAESRYAANPGAVVEAVARLFDAHPELFLQSLLFGVFSLPLRPLVIGGSKPFSARRRWGVALYLSAFLAAFLVFPPMLTGVAVDLGRFFLAFIPCGIISTLFGLLTPAEEPHTTSGR